MNTADVNMFIDHITRLILSMSQLTHTHTSVTCWFEACFTSKERTGCKDWVCDNMLSPRKSARKNTVMHHPPTETSEK